MATDGSGAPPLCLEQDGSRDAFRGRGGFVPRHGRKHGSRGPAPPPPLALPAPPHSRGARVGQGRPMTRDAVARGDPLFKENPSGQSRRDAHHALGEPKVRGSHLRRVGLGTPRAGGDKH